MPRSVRIGEGARARTMPLHDWTEMPGWDGVHQVWIVELLYWIKPRLPEGYRAYLGTTPTFAIGAPAEERPDGGVRDGPWADGPQAASTPLPSAAPDNSAEEPDQEMAVATLQGE